MINWNAWLLGGSDLVEPSKYKTFATHIPADAQTLQNLFVGLTELEESLNAAFKTFRASERGYFTPDEDDAVRRMLLSYRNFRLATFSTVWRYVHYPRETDLKTQLQGFILGYAAALMMFSKSLRFIQMSSQLDVVRRKLNEPDERFGIDSGFFDEVVETYASFRYLALFAAADRFWRKHRADISRLGLDDDIDVGIFIPYIRRLRVRCWQLFWPTIANRIKHERRHKFGLLFAPVKMTGWGAQTMLGHAVARMRTTLDYRPAIDSHALDYLNKRLHVGDLLFTRTEHKTSTALLPGFFGHVATYVGHPEDLKAMGLWDAPSMARVREAMAGVEAPRGWVLEAIHSGVLVRPLEATLECDHVLVLRPNQTEGEIAQRLTDTFAHFGKPYDFDFDFSRTSHVVCTELVYRAMHKRGPFEFTLVKRMGRFTLTIDDIVRQFLRDEARAPGAWIPVALLHQWQKGKAYPGDPAAVSDTLKRILAVDKKDAPV